MHIVVVSGRSSMVADGRWAIHSIRVFIVFAAHVMAEPMTLLTGSIHRVDHQSAHPHTIT